MTPELRPCSVDRLLFRHLCHLGKTLDYCTSVNNPTRKFLSRNDSYRMTPMKSLLLLPIAALALSVAACDVKKTQEGEAPKVKVEGGQVPKYDVKGPDVSVDKKDTTVTVPEVKVEKKEKTVTLPDVNVKTGSEKRAEEEAAKPAPAPAAPQ
jgi:hypothetical protein